jgi:hypothetical protein
MTRAMTACGEPDCPNVCAGYFCPDHAPPDAELVEAVTRLAGDGSAAARERVDELVEPLLKGPDEWAEGMR